MATYRDAGVDLDAADAAVARMRPSVTATGEKGHPPPRARTGVSRAIASPSRSWIIAIVLRKPALAVVTTPIRQLAAVRLQIDWTIVRVVIILCL